MGKESSPHTTIQPYCQPANKDHEYFYGKGCAYGMQYYLAIHFFPRYTVKQGLSAHRMILCCLNDRCQKAIARAIDNKPPYGFCIGDIPDDIPEVVQISLKCFF